MCCFHMDIARKGGGVKAFQDGLGHFFSTCACVTEGGGSKAYRPMSIYSHIPIYAHTFPSKQNYIDESSEKA